MSLEARQQKRAPIIWLYGIQRIHDILEREAQGLVPPVLDPKKSPRPIIKRTFLAREFTNFGIGVKPYELAFTVIVF